MAKKRVLILTDTLPWGHRSIAKAIYGYLKENEKGNGYETYYAEAKIPAVIINQIYTFIYRFFPLSNRLSVKIMENDALRKMFVRLSEIESPDVSRQIRWYKPDLVISAYFLHTSSLVALREKEKSKYKIWTVVSDPWSINPISFVVGADKHIVYDEVSKKQALKYEIDEKTIVETGWWVRQEMYEVKVHSAECKVRSRKKLGFNDERPVIFVGGGSLGTNSLTKLLPVLMMVKKKVGVVFNTGTDKLAYSMVNEYANLLRRVRKDDFVQIKNLGWIDNMAEVLSACDIVFGKAGPNFLFDVVAVEKPFVAITHIGGQEDGNISLIKKKGLGWVKEKGGNAAEFLLRFLDNPKKYTEKYKKTIHLEAMRNKKSAQIIRELVGKELE
ncbi:hypothetical protein KBC75_04750 [Candidatus Shapirobacteria bacterium]|nr:hypothetical protein [Candidatus Shapirobacteria bacterium]